MPSTNYKVKRGIELMSIFGKLRNLGKKSPKSSTETPLKNNPSFQEAREIFLNATLAISCPNLPETLETIDVYRNSITDLDNQIQLLQQGPNPTSEDTIQLIKTYESRKSSMQDVINMYMRNVGDYNQSAADLKKAIKDSHPNLDGINK